MTTKLEEDGILATLARKAQRIEADRERDQASARARDAALRDEVCPRLRELHAYFRQLKGHLDVVQPEVVGRFQIPGFGALTGLTQGEYAVYTTDQGADVRRFTFQYAFRKQGSIEVRLPGWEGVASYKRQLWDHGLRFKLTDGADGTSRLFTIQARIPVSFTFCVDPERLGVRLTMRNVGVLGTVVNTLRADQIDANLTAELAKSVLGEPHDLDELLGNALTKSMRFRIGRNLMREIRQRHAAAHDAAEET